MDFFPAKPVVPVDKLPGFHSSVSSNSAASASGSKATLAFTVPAGCIFRGHLQTIVGVAPTSGVDIFQGVNPKFGSNFSNGGYVELQAGSYIFNSTSTAASNMISINGAFWKVA
ncbi:MAG TPA: hypothetical protein PL182_06400 [Pseudobdellovibrionaceae bacterium]|nr:hypothetical protein [Pseudobdellovibrionaceae bacterium]